MEGLELYDIILDGFIEVLHLHGVKEVEIPNALTLSTAEKCIEKLQNTIHISEYKAAGTPQSCNELPIEKTFTIIKEDGINRA